MNSVKDPAFAGGHSSATQQRKPLHRSYQHESYEIFKNATQCLKRQPEELCEQLGFSKYTYKGWEKEGLMPRVASVACNALVQCTVLAQDQPKERVVLLKITSEEQWTTLHSLHGGRNQDQPSPLIRISRNY